MIHTSVSVVGGVVVLALLTIGGSKATDYCNPLLCDEDEKHIGCNNNNTFYSTCDTPALVDFVATLQTLVLNTQNDYRNRLASGSTQFASAVRMPPIRWNTELAKLAEYNVRQCAMKHDECRNTDTFPYAGQNLGNSGTTSPLTPTKIEAYIKKVQDNWYAENISTTQAWLDNYPSETNGKTIGHFTAMMQEHTAYIGCAAATYKRLSGTTTYNTVLLACDYSCTNMIDSPIYTKGPVASQCTTGTDSTYTSLCSLAEVISPTP